MQSRIYREAVGIALAETNLTEHTADLALPRDGPYTPDNLIEGELNALGIVKPAREV